MTRLVAAGSLLLVSLLLPACGGWWDDDDDGDDDGPVLVRVRISDFDGSEPSTLTSDTHPHLFDLDPRIDVVELTFVNPAAPVKNDVGPAVWFPALTPIHALNATPGYIQLTIVPLTSALLSYDEVTFTTAARFPGNPSSLRLQSSTDGFESTLRTIDMSVEDTSTVGLGTLSSAAPFSLRWEANNDFGDNGGGEAGFASEDVVLRETVP
jgi:hypothetical protein